MQSAQVRSVVFGVRGVRGVSGEEGKDRERRRRFSDVGALDVVGGGSGAEFRGIIVLLLKQVHLQNEGGAGVVRVSLVEFM